MNPVFKKRYIFETSKHRGVETGVSSGLQNR